MREEMKILLILFLFSCPPVLLPSYFLFYSFPRCYQEEPGHISRKLARGQNKETTTLAGYERGRGGYGEEPELVICLYLPLFALLDGNIWEYLGFPSGQGGGIES